ncbi:MAG: hypothetical protein ACREL6_03495, partial [Gemmatimonadales bacterium]
ATRARFHTDQYEAEIGALSATRHDVRTTAEALAVFAAMGDYADRSEEFARATAAAVEQVARVEDRGLFRSDEWDDTPFEREEMLTSFHEGGHAHFGEQSWLMVPLRSEIKVTQPWLCKPRGCGVVEFRYTKNPEKWNRRDFLEDASCALAGPVAEAYWQQRVEGRDFQSAVRESYATGGSSDHEAAMESTGGNPKMMASAEPKAFRVVIRRWSSIANMAEVLRERKRMSAGQIHRSA